jgi:hypothetical protein
VTVLRERMSPEYLERSVAVEVEKRREPILRAIVQME